MPRVPEYTTDVTLKVPRDERLVDNTAWWPIVVFAGLGAIFLIFALWTHFTFLSGEPRIIEREKIVERPIYLPPPSTPPTPSKIDVVHSGTVLLEERPPATLSCEASCHAKYTGDFAEACIDGYCPRQ